MDARSRRLSCSNPGSVGAHRQVTRAQGPADRGRSNRVMHDPTLGLRWQRSPLPFACTSSLAFVCSLAGRTGPDAASGPTLRAALRCERPGCAASSLMHSSTLRHRHGKGPSIRARAFFDAVRRSTESAFSMSAQADGARTQSEPSTPTDREEWRGDECRIDATIILSTTHNADFVVR